ncbi:MAG: hypothetical protein JWM76_4766 [Pseudonocardiales bacterium]|nr:hypothetical protein [Pseudonocardiales bacterium]
MLLAAIFLGLLLISTGSTAHADAADTLQAGQCLEAGTSLTSSESESQYRLVIQFDGNVVEYGNGRALWSTGTYGSSGPARLCLQVDGNLVVSAGGVVRWSTGTAGSGGVRVVLQADANLVVYSAQGPVWNTGGPGKEALAAGGTLEAGQYLLSPDRRFQLIAQTDGNLVLYAPEGALWSTSTFGTGLTTVLQTDGNLVVYNGQGRALWNSGSAGRGASAKLVSQSDGNLVLYSGPAVVWSTGTWRVASAPTGYDGSSSQVVAVVAPRAASTTAVLTGWSHTPSGWVVAVAPTVARVGSEGVGATAENVQVTPAGTYSLAQAFGRQPNPGTMLPYLRTDPLDWWDENSASPTYNLHVRQVPSPGGYSENLYNSGSVYDYAVVIGYNAARTPYAGSGFFLHVTDGQPTAGCVAVPVTTMVDILRWLNPSASPVIMIGVG